VRETGWARRILGGDWCEGGKHGGGNGRSRGIEKDWSKKKGHFGIICELTEIYLSGFAGALRYDELETWKALFPV
jgi:hypothetical protein